ncbi:plant UBX domain-containing protein 11 [Dendrobium catenatum]|uniref:UBX domain-containing protein n=1 Tax=Dendrobium catenatum TaxID=906689 RepID=A0A2I0WLR3_9ASPA|nr:plant UBX domain-containing protein 11 [Dendrobium catenatum]XP_020703481.1 plant UBX domain-containing protein 11 [Dendrobium catenatum]XP_028551909.1 plant UBX domain-containing protein 11 [Dendrobium catenatum]XP_028551910.1 plant UBX domain-containing protein 11 [Dendrobium catenatum]PKU76588.1 hypothetical protein MA16_Dca001192 [Dendrobium catenatum]
MEKSTAYLTYKGSISEAIVEAQNQKKLFLVFISGDDENSANLENSTWLDDQVGAAVSRYCIFLHLIQGHVEASQFSAIYPQKAVPSISAVGYNGLMLWQHEGYIDCETFIESIEKAWAAMHFQDTATVLLSAALASKKPDPSSSSSTDVASVEQGESSSLHDPSSLAGNEALNVEAEPSNDPEALVEQQVEDVSEDDNAMQLDTANAAKVYSEDRENKENETKEISHSATHNIPDFLAVPREYQSIENHPNSSPEPVVEIHLSSSGSSQINAIEVQERTHSVPDEIIDSENTIKSTTIHLSIRMPSGTSLQEKFTITDRLKSVKNYVDDNNDSNLGSYDLAIPYPRKVFGEEDMSKALSELGFAGRQALIVIPRSGVSGHQRVSLPSNDIQTAANQTTSNDNGIGYFGYLKRALSYLNPFSYLGGNGGQSCSEQAPNVDLWQYRPNPGLQNSLSRMEALRNQYSSNPQNTIASASTSRSSSRPFGSNIHTLRQDEDDFSSRDRNTFWNGNSTQYGGNDQ